MEKPQKLQKGDTIAVLSPSWGGPGTFPHVHELGVERLRGFGFEIKEYPTTRGAAAENYAHPEKRAADFMAAIQHPDVKGIIASIGGDDSIRLLPYLDAEVIRKNPKFIMGFSDTTTLLSYCNQLGLVTFNGPSVMAGFAEQGKQREDFAAHIEEFLFGNWETYTYTPYAEWTEQELEWADPENLQKFREFQPSDAWRALQGSEPSQGQLFGGCIEVLEFMKGTQFWPEPDFWNGKILFLETSEEKPDVNQVKYWLRNYGMQGVFEQLNGLLFGRARDYSDEEKQELDNMILQIVHGEFGAEFPILTNLDFGHTSPQLIMPLGVQAEIDPAAKTLKLLESPFV